MKDLTWNAWNTLIDEKEFSKEEANTKILLSAENETFASQGVEGCSLINACLEAFYVDSV